MLSSSIKLTVTDANLKFIFEIVCDELGYTYLSSDGAVGKIICNDSGDEVNIASLCRVFFEAISVTPISEIDAHACEQSDEDYRDYIDMLYTYLTSKYFIAKANNLTIEKHTNNSIYSIQTLKNDLDILNRLFNDEFEVYSECVKSILNRCRARLSKLSSKSNVYTMYAKTSHMRLSLRKIAFNKRSRNRLLFSENHGLTQYLENDFIEWVLKKFNLNYDNTDTVVMVRVMSSYISNYFLNDWFVNKAPDYMKNSSLTVISGEAFDITDKLSLPHQTYVDVNIYSILDKLSTTSYNLFGHSRIGMKTDRLKTEENLTDLKLSKLQYSVLEYYISKKLEDRIRKINSDIHSVVVGSKHRITHTHYNIKSGMFKLNVDYGTNRLTVTKSINQSNEFVQKIKSGIAILDNVYQYRNSIINEEKNTDIHTLARRILNNLTGNLQYVKDRQVNIVDLDGSSYVVLNNGLYKRIVDILQCFHDLDLLDSALGKYSLSLCDLSVGDILEPEVYTSITSLDSLINKMYSKCNYDYDNSVFYDRYEIETENYNSCIRHEQNPDNITFNPDLLITSWIIAFTDAELFTKYLSKEFQNDKQDNTIKIDENLKFNYMDYFLVVSGVGKDLDKYFKDKLNESKQTTEVITFLHTLFGDLEISDSECLIDFKLDEEFNSILEEDMESEDEFISLVDDIIDMSVYSPVAHFMLDTKINPAIRIFAISYILLNYRECLSTPWFEDVVIPEIRKKELLHYKSILSKRKPEDICKSIIYCAYGIDDVVYLQDVCKELSKTFKIGDTESLYRIASGGVIYRSRDGGGWNNTLTLSDDEVNLEIMFDTGHTYSSYTTNDNYRIKINGEPSDYRTVKDLTQRKDLTELFEEIPDNIHVTNCLKDIFKTYIEPNTRIMLMDLFSTNSHPYRDAYYKHILLDMRTCIYVMHFVKYLEHSVYTRLNDLSQGFQTSRKLFTFLYDTCLSIVKEQRKTKEVIDGLDVQDRSYSYEALSRLSELLDKYIELDNFFSKLDGVVVECNKRNFHLVESSLNSLGISIYTNVAKTGPFMTKGIQELNIDLIGAVLSKITSKHLAKLKEGIKYIISRKSLIDSKSDLVTGKLWLKGKNINRGEDIFYIYSRTLIQYTETEEFLVNIITTRSNTESVRKFESFAVGKECLGDTRESGLADRFLLYKDGTHVWTEDKDNIYFLHSTGVVVQLNLDTYEPSGISYTSFLSKKLAWK